MVPRMPLAKAIGTRSLAVLTTVIVGPSRSTARSSSSSQGPLASRGGGLQNILLVEKIDHESDSSIRTA